MQCMNENCDNELIGRQKTYCSDKCRKAQSRTDESRTSKPGQPKSDRPKYIKDACGTEHLIDYEGRARTRDILESWADGEGTTYQQNIGKLARHYEVA